MYTQRVGTFSSGMNGNPLGGTQFNHGPFEAAGIRAWERWFGKAKLPERQGERI
jgi:hypothetical protein